MPLGSLKEGETDKEDSPTYEVASLIFLDATNTATIKDVSLILTDKDGPTSLALTSPNADNETDITVP